MRRNNRILSFFMVLVLCFCLYFQITGNSINSDVNFDYQESFELSLVSLESDEQIYIDNDTDFVSLGCPGSGTPENPYRIENKSIIIDDFSPGIKVFATTKHFIIQNCYFEKLSRGIELSYVASNTSIIRNNVFKYHRLTAISIYSTNYTIIENNTGRNVMEGIYVFNSYFSSIVNNSFIGCYDYYDGMLNPSGMKIYRSYYGSIINNTIINFEQGIYTRESSGFIIENNTCLYCRYEGSISLYLSSDMIVRRNLIYHNLQWCGIFLMETNNCKILDNTIYHCPVWGIALVGSDHNMVYHNNLLSTTILQQEQAFDNGINNTWYLWYLEEGNYWSDWSGTGPYEIDGSVPSYNYDLYPLSDLYGIELEDLYFPNTTNDDIYEENDYAFNNPVIALTITHNLHYADADFFRINLQKSWKYRFTIEFDYNIIDLDFYLLEEDFHEAVFNPLNYSISRNDIEQFTYIAPNYGDYYLLIIGDLEHYKDIIPSDYQLTITTLAYITPSITSSSLSMKNWFVVIATAFIITFCIRSYKKLRKVFQK